MPACTYSLQPDANFNLLGGTGTCSVTTQPGCAWTATTDVGWISLTGTTSGSGNGSIPYSVAALTLGIRNGRVGITQASNPRCAISQALLRPAESGASWESELAVEGARGQVVIDGASVSYQDQGAGHGTFPSAPGQRQVVAQLVAAKGRPGTWTFRLGGSARSGSLRPLAGNPAQVTGDSITFRLTGKPGERLVFTFESIP